MKLKVERHAFYNDTTLGVLYVNNVFEAFTLEDKIRTHKIYGKTAIPAGIYDVVITYSPKFGRKLPLLKNVPEFDGIRIHTGNTHEDTGGCLLVGASVAEKTIYESRKAFNKLFKKLEKAQDSGEKITIEIKDKSTKEKRAGKKIIAWTSACLVSLFAGLGIRKIIKNRNKT